MHRWHGRRQAVILSADVLNLLRQIELSLASGSSVETACYADDEAFPGE